MWSFLHNIMNLNFRLETQISNKIEIFKNREIFDRSYGFFLHILVEEFDEFDGYIEGAYYKADYIISSEKRRLICLKLQLIIETRMQKKKF